MISELSLRNFKCYKKVDIKFSKVNILTGTNSSGKSTIIQALKLYEETNEENIKKIQKKDGGTIQIIDLIQKQENHFIGYDELKRKRSLYHADFDLHDSNDTFSIAVDNKTKEYIEVLYHELTPKNNLAEVRAEEFVSNNILFVHADRYYNNNQIPGNFSKYYIPDNGNKNMADYIFDHSLQPFNSASNELSKVLREIGLIKDSIQVVKNRNSFEFTVDSKPIELVGSGVRYTIPILLTVMTNKNSVICIENPELHLHPKAQIKLVDYLIKICEERDNQLIIETHSDHIINSICVHIKEKEECDPSEYSTFFIKDQDIQLIPLNSNGQFTKTVPDFFDEYEIQLEKLIW